MPSESPKDSPKSRAQTPLAVAIVAAVLVMTVGAIWLAWAPQTASTSLVGGPFSLQDGAGKTITDKALLGKPFLVYFGYTHCPDVCPTELARISDVLARMGDKAVPTLFITVDPERDTPKVMGDYVSSFDSHIAGLSGSPQDVSAAERAYRVFARKGKTETNGDYPMDHSSVVYLMNKSGQFVEALNVDRPPDEVAKEIAGYL
jgi:protein SCO1